MSDRTNKEYIERLTEAQLEGRPLPPPSDDGEADDKARFEETEALLEEVRDVQLSSGWQDRVWARIGEDAVDGDSGDGDMDDDEGEVIDARGRFGWWPALAGAVAAAAVLLAVSTVFMVQSGSDEGPGVMPGDRSEAQVASGTLDEEAAPAGNTEQLMAKAVAPPAQPIEGLRGAEGRPFGESMKGEKEFGGYEGGAPGEGRALGDIVADGDATVTLAAAEGEDTGSAGLMDPAAAAVPADLATGAGAVAMDKLERMPKDRRDVGGERKAMDRLRTQPRLTAGEIDDNRMFGDYQRFLSERSKSHLEPMDVSERVFVRVLDVDNKPVPNAKVSFLAGGQTAFTGTTYADGWTLFHPRTVPQAAGAQQFDLQILVGQQTHSHTISRGARERWQVRLPVQRQIPARAKLDLVFLIDTTSSMADEIERLQATVIQIAEDVALLPSQPEVRFGLVLYRDDTDEYVSKVYPFESNVRVFQQTLATVDASGGGDLPERLEVGLHRSVHELAWSQDATRLVFLVADASPHAKSQNEFSYSRDIQLAASQGIKVFPVASSGLDDDGEYVFRQLAQFTMARFVFLTYGASGTETPHDVKPGSFQPETLDRLVVRIVREELVGLEMASGTGKR